MIENWQRIDKSHSVCSRCCTALPNEKVRGGMCGGCKARDSERREIILTRAESRVVAKSAAEFMAAIHNQSKEGAAMPRIMDRFYECIGGREKVGELMADEFQRARGVGVHADFEVSPKIILGWFELIARHQAKVDDGRQLDLSGLDEEAIHSILAGVAEKWIAENPEYRKKILRKIMEVEPSLIHEAMEQTGMGCVEAKDVTIVPDSEYDPFSDEYTE